MNTILLDALQKKPGLQCVIANRQDDATKYLPRRFQEEIAKDRFHNIYGLDGGTPIGVKLALEKNLLLEKVKSVCERKTVTDPF